MTVPRDSYGSIDVYLFDQVLRERVTPGMTVLDAGCATGRNLEYFLRAGYAVRGLDPVAERIGELRARACEWQPAGAPAIAAEHFRVETLEDSSFEDATADLVICNAVLHFARDPAHFSAMLDGAWRLLAPGGVFFCRLASRIGSLPVRHLGGGRYLQDDGDQRFLVDRFDLEREGQRLGAVLLDPVKTTLVEDLRAMTTWVLAKPER